MELKRVFDLLAYQCQKYPRPDAINSKVKGQWVSYGSQQVAQIVDRLSLGLLKLGIRKGDAVAIVSPNRPEWNFADLAIQQIGAVSVPMYPTISVDDYRYIFHHAEVKAVFVADEPLYEKVAAATRDLELYALYSFDRVEGLTHWTDLEKLGESGELAQLEAARATVDENDLLTIIYTSGTTGRPKGVMLSHHNVLSNTISSARGLASSPNGTGKALSFLPLCHIYERTGFFVFIYKGLGIYYAESMETIGDNLREVKPDTFNTVPRLLEKVYDKIVAKGMELTGAKKKLFFWALNLGLIHEPNQNQGGWYNWQLKMANKLIFSKWREALGGNIKTIQSGAAALQPRLSRVFWAAGIPISEGYGMTEASPVITSAPTRPADVRVGTVGTAIEGVEIKIADDGEILCKGPNVMLGYYKEPELTAETLKDGWLHTGDVGEIVEGKYLRITDRKKEMFKTSGGKYIAPQPMENKFKESLLIEQIMVIGENRKFPAALIIPAFDTLREWCRQHDIACANDEEMVHHPRVVAKFGSEIDQLNGSFGDWEKVKKFKVLAQPWGIDSGELTPTLKLKRRVIINKYQTLIEEIYTG
ncbi:MAG: long-chain fatty acid--CoA ligase [Bernardetiaceae bacterium]|jgi:long-chain acyl-CoA synthetase|nr:long-chain fatty acid--CoA ligase [Bernardetiaceae bacterium]